MNPHQHPRLAAASIALLLALAAPGCKTAQILTDVGTAVGVATGEITPEQAESIRRSGDAVYKAFERLTPEQEYYIGRAVTASILDTYAPLDTAPAATRYLNTMGKALALFSERPETFGGWHFLIMDTDEINAFAAPGGFILISRGMLRCTTNEDELAAVLAHEIGHVEFDHGLRAIKKSRWTTAFTILGTEAAKNLGGQDLAQLTAAFEGAISDVTATMVNSGYARKLEREADQAAIRILQRAGYNPTALQNMLATMEQQLAHDDRGFARTHPPPQARIQDIQDRIRDSHPVQEHPVRQKRFQNAIAHIRP